MSRSTSIKSIFVIVILLLGSVAMAQDYRILVTNDDGIESELLLALVLELRKIADVTVSAPRVNQSGTSQASTSGALQVEEIRSNGALFGYGVTGTPTDAVRYGLRVLGADKPFDLVVSGINLGANVGKVSHMSGTVGAAMQAVYLGVPAIAVSQDTSNVDTTVTARLVSDLVKRYQQQGAPQGTVVSINVPGGDLKGVVMRPMGDSYLADSNYALTSNSEGLLMYERSRAIARSEDNRTDTWAYQNGYATVTPLRLDWTDYELLAEMLSWELQLAE